MPALRDVSKNIKVGPFAFTGGGLGERPERAFAEDSYAAADHRRELMEEMGRNEAFRQQSKASLVEGLTTS